MILSLAINAILVAFGAYLAVQGVAFGWALVGFGVVCGARVTEQLGVFGGR